MKQIFLILKREYTTRVKKKSFLLATILTPLLFPTIVFGIIYLSTRDGDSGPKEVFVLDESGYFQNEFNDADYTYNYVDGTLEEAKTQFQEEGAYGLMYIPKIDLDDTSKTFYDDFAFYSKTNPGMQIMQGFSSDIRKTLERIKLDRSGLDPAVINSLKVSVDLDSYNVTESGEAKKSNSGLSYGVGYLFGFLIYIFIFVYGSQIMQSVLDEKTSRIVEVIVSSVRPFQLMMGKILGVGSVGLTQLLIWVSLVTLLSTVGFSVIGGGVEMGQTADLSQSQEVAAEVQNALSSIPITQIVLCFLFYFVGAYLLYSALYAAVGSAVDNLQDAQQFMFPIIVPLIAAIVALNVVLQDPNSTMAVTLSMIPFTSPIIMMGRLPFGVPTIELIASMVLLVLGFIGTTWVAGRIYRVGILMHGVKVNWKTISKWFTMKI